MPRSARSASGLIVLLVFGLVLLARPPFGPAQPKEQDTAGLSPEERIFRALKEPTEVEADKTQLSKVLEDLGKRHKIEIHMDRRSLKSVGTPADWPITRSLHGVSLRSALRLLLNDLGLDYTIDDEFLLVSTPADTELHLILRMYPVGDLILGRDEDGQLVEDEDSLVDLITSTVQPNTWGEVGGPGNLVIRQGVLIVNQSLDVHEEIERILAMLRTMPSILDDKAERATKPVPLWQTSAERKIYGALEEPTDWDFKDRTLEDVAKYIRERHKIEVQVDLQSLAEVGVGVDTPVNHTIGKARPVTLRNALRMLLSALDLAYVVRYEVLLITTPEESEASLRAVAYPVLDLLQLPEGASGARVAWELDKLGETLMKIVDAESWDEVGGLGAITPFANRGALVASQVLPNQHAIEAALTKFRAARKAMPEGAVSANKPLVLRVYALPTPEKENSPPVLDADDVLEVIIHLIEPESWKTTEGVYIKATSSRIVVKHTPWVHQRIEELLGNLSYATPLQYSGGGFFAVP